MGTLRSAICQQFQHDLISKIYQRIKNNKDKNLFKLITKILIFDAADFKDLDQMIRFFEFGYEWLQHPEFENLYIHDFNLIFMRIITIFNNILFQCKNEQIVNISTDIVTSISLHFSTSINNYCATPSNLTKIGNILIKMSEFYMNSLEIDIGHIQFHSIENITLFLHSIILCSNKLRAEQKEKIYNECILKLLSKLLASSFCSHFINITDLCLWTVCNFYYEIARYNVSDKQQQQNQSEDFSVSESESLTMSMDGSSAPITMDMDDRELIIESATKMMENPDYRIRRWCGLLIFFRFYMNQKQEQKENEAATTIYKQLLLDFDDFVSKPLLTLIQTENTEEIIEYIETSQLLLRPNRLLTAQNLENDEVLIEGRSDTASINQARSKNNINNKYLFDNLEYDEVDDIDDISSPSQSEEEEDEIDIKYDANKENKNNINMEEDESNSPNSTSSEDTTSSISDSPVLSDEFSKKKKVEIPLLPLHQINDTKIQTNIVQNEHQKEIIKIVEEERGIDADDEREESLENEMESQPENIQNAENNEYVTFKRGDNEDKLKYIDSFLQSISVSESYEKTEDALNVDDIAVDVEVNDEEQQQSILDDERLEEFRKSDINDYLVHDIPTINNRKKGWWMKYVNHQQSESE